MKLMHLAVDCRHPLIEDCQHYGRTVRHMMMHSASIMMMNSASFMMLNDAQCDFGNFEALAKKIFKYQKYYLEVFFLSFYYMNDAHSASFIH